MTDGQHDIKELWSEAVGRLRASIPGAAHEAWLAQSNPVTLDAGVLVVEAPNEFAREQIKKRFADELKQAVSAVAGTPVTVIVTAASGDHAPLEPVGDLEATVMDPLPPATLAPASAESPSSGVQTGNLSDKYIFERFVIGPSNRFAHAAAFAVAEAPAKAYNPLFIYGGSGLGKTHLIQAIGHYATRLDPRLKVRYVTSEQFTSEFIEGVRSGHQTTFQRRYRDVDVLLLDDVQFLERAERTQEEFFHTFNALHHAEKQIVLTSDRPPRRLERLEERLRTRFEMGLLTDVQPPDLETRLAILRRKAELDIADVPGEVLELIAGRISSNIRELEGALIRVIAAASLSKRPVTLSLAESSLKDVFPESPAGQITVELIKDQTSKKFGFTVDELCSSTRTRALVNARQIAMYLTRELTPLSLPKIGEAFGGRDHTTVIHAYKKIAKHMKERPQTFEQIQELTGLVKLAAAE